MRSDFTDSELLHELSPCVGRCTCKICKIRETFKKTGKLTSQQRGVLQRQWDKEWS